MTSATTTSPDPRRKQIVAALIPVLIGVAIWFTPAPADLKPQAWHMFAIFAATIAGILTQPLPSGAIMLIAITVAIFTKTMTEAKALAGFANGTVWLIFWDRSAIDAALQTLRSLGCNTTGPLEGMEAKICSVNVPASVEFTKVDAVLEPLEQSERIAVAYPSYRHTDG